MILTTRASGFLARARCVRLRRSIRPSEEKAHVAWKAVREIEDACGQVKAARLQITLPPQIDLGGLAAQGLGPARQQRVYCPSTIGAEIRRETQQHEFFLATGGGFAGVMQQRAPVVLADVLIDELCDAAVLLLCLRTAPLVLMLDLVTLEISAQAAEIGDR